MAHKLDFKPELLEHPVFSAGTNETFGYASCRKVEYS